MKKIELRKSPVIFDAETHTYHLDGVILNGVTSTLIKRAFPDKYKDVDPSVLARAAEKGHALHEAIEFYDNFGHTDNEDPRIESYERLKKDNNLRTIANEYLVSDEKHYASSIDIVMLNEKDEICLVDTKTTYALDRQSTGLQLSIYKMLFEMQNPGLSVEHIYVLWLPNKDTSIAELSELSFIDDDVILRLMEADLDGQSFDITTTYGDLPERIASVEDEIVRLETETKEMKQRQDALKTGLYDLMEQFDVKSFRGSKVMLTRVLPSKSESLDSKRLKEEQPDIYKKYVKTSERSGSLKITILNK